MGHSRADIDAVTEHARDRGSAAIGPLLWRRKDGALVDVDVSVGKLRHGDRDVVFIVARTVADAGEPAAWREERSGRAAELRRRVRDDAAAAARLSRREGQVLRLLAYGFSNRQIATRLKLSVKTVETFRARLYRKLGLRGRPALVRHALRAGLFASKDASAEE